MKKYVFFCELPYSYSILRPLQEAIRNRGDEVGWFLEKSCPNHLLKDELLLPAIDDVIAYNPIAIFSAGDYIYDFFPGIKVAVFHGYPINKRNDTIDVHFRIRGWYDIYCTQGPSSTLPFKKLEAQYGYFKVYETGWVKADSYFHALQKARCIPSTAASRQYPMPKDGGNDYPNNNIKSFSVCAKRPLRVLYASTFSKNITSAPIMVSVIEKLAVEKPWHWLLTLHPKMSEELKLQYKGLAERHPNIQFMESITPEDMAQTDVLLCDSSSIIVEYMLLNKPVVTFRNTIPGSHLINVTDVAEIPIAIETAFTRPQKLMNAIQHYTSHCEAHFDGNNCERVLNAIDDFVEHYQGRLRPKPHNLFRKLKLRLRIGYFGNIDSLSRRNHKESDCEIVPF